MLVTFVGYFARLLLLFTWRCEGYVEAGWIWVTGDWYDLERGLRGNTTFNCISFNGGSNCYCHCTQALQLATINLGDEVFDSILLQMFCVV